MKRLIVPALATLSLLLAGCGDSGAEQDTPRASSTGGTSNLEAVIGEIDELSIADKMLDNADLTDPFDGAGAYTIFLPDNAAFEALSAAQRKRLESKEGRPEGIAFLTHHIAVGAVARADLDRALDANGGSIELESVVDEPIEVRKIDGQIFIGKGDDAPRLTGTSELASNGVVYVIDGFIPSAK